MAVKKKPVKKAPPKKTGRKKEITKRNWDLINALCQVPTPKLIDAAKSLNITYGSAKQMLLRPMVFEALEEARAKISTNALAKAEVDATYVLIRSKELVERCMQHEPVYDKEGNPVMVETPAGDIAPAYTFDAAGAARGLKLIGDHIEVSAFKPKDEDGNPIDQNWRVTIVDSKTGKQKVLGPES